MVDIAARRLVGLPDDQAVDELVIIANAYQETALKVAPHLSAA
jgi:hypothetical protein